MTIYALPLAMLAGALLHELVHAAAAVLVGGSVEDLDLWSLHCDFRAPTAARQWLVLQAPALVGLSLLPGVLWLVEGFESAVVVLAGWGALTLMGGRGEFGIMRLVESRAQR
jgi:hypothetical protein